MSVDRPAAARRMLDRLLGRIGQLAAFPESGVTIAALGPSVRSLSSPPYVVIYEARPDRARVVQVLHAARRRPTT
ncbi:MAG: type II toxin-antitoxin system RelE/ParE family toxin [Oceanicaulis sp.]